jgi:flagellum-specific ATP synthase
MNNPVLDLAFSGLALANLVELRGYVSDVSGLVVESMGPKVSVGSQVTIASGERRLLGQVVGFRHDRTLVMPYGEAQGIAPGATVIATERSSAVPVGASLQGRVLDALGDPLDGLPPPICEDVVPLNRLPPNPVTRTRIQHVFETGVRSLDTMITLGSGQRVGIMAGSGVGKSTLLGMIAKLSTSDVAVIGLIGERGREVREFIERDLGEAGLAKSVVVVATGDQSALLRLRAAYLATAYAEYFRAQGKQVVLMLDSVTRLAMAQREVGLAVGEPPSTRGYTPSVFSMLPKLLERAGTDEGSGSITGLYTVLVEGDDMNEPVADATRGILDGHIVLSRKLAHQGHFPAIEVLESVSRVMSDVATREDVLRARKVRELLNQYKEVEDLITIGAYKRGANPRIDRAVDLYPVIQQFLQQQPHERSSRADAIEVLDKVLEHQADT